MGRIDYDRLAGLQRLGEARAKLDERAGTILTYHAALEREMDIVLARLLRRAEKLRGLSFAHKISVLNAAWRGPDDAGDIFCHALFRFNELRNAVAHGDPPEEVDKKLALLAESFDAILPGSGELRDVEPIAAGMVGFLADEPLDASKLKIPAPEGADEQHVAGHAGSEGSAAPSNVSEA